MRDLGRTLPRDPRGGMPQAERARWRQPRAGVRVPDLRARLPDPRRARGARARRGLLARLLAAARGDDRLPRVHDGRGGTAAHGRRRATTASSSSWPPEPGFSPHGSLIATGAVLFERPDLAAKAGALDGKTVTLLGVQAVRRLAQLKQRCRAGFRPRLQFTESGYYLMGDAFDTPDEVRMLVDAGPLGYLSIAAHGHADALVVHAQHRRSRNPRRPGNLCVSHRA